MTDNEIIKALECCGSNGWGEEDKRPCDKCPMQECEDCEVELPDYALNLINRQKAEIEKLKTQLGKRENFFTIKLEKEQLNDIVKSQFEKFEVDAVTVKNETIREFADQLKRFICLEEDEGSDFREEMYFKIESLAKEMTEDKKNDPE